MTIQWQNNWLEYPTFQGCVQTRDYKVIMSDIQKKNNKLIKNKFGNKY